MGCSSTVLPKTCGKTGVENKASCCPTCGAVECLCRPRFFAGQLLSEQDLNRLDQYIKNKNRLHNRNLHGWGVVNGLKVLCDPCGSVKVTEGYAVDPCGDDIVVCDPSSVDICALIQKCKHTVKANCVPPTKNRNSACEDVEEEWVLTIQYQEWPSRGVTALRGSTCRSGSCSGSSCSCGGSGSSCGCGASAKTSCSCGTSSGGSGKSNRASPPECEPTIVCEGFSFDVYKKPVVDPKQDDDKSVFNLGGSFAEEFNCCAQALIKTVPPSPDLQTDDLYQYAAAVSKWCCSWKKNLVDYFLSHPNTSCEVIEFLQAVECPSLLKPGSFSTDFMVSFLSLLAAWAEGLKVCLCLALLPPTPDSTCDKRVPLATVRVRSRDCKVLSICNWTMERKIMVTWPAMGHWLGIFSIGEFFHQLLDTLCCRSLLGIFEGILDDFPQRDPFGDSNNNNKSEHFMMMSSAETGSSATEPSQFKFSEVLSQFSGEVASRLTLADVNAKSSNFSEFIGSSLARGDKPLEIGALLNGVSPRFKMPDNGQKLSEVEAQNVPLLLISEMVVKPFASTVLGDKEMSRQMDNIFKAQKSSSSTGDEKVQTQLQTMQKQLDEQAKVLADMTSKLANKK